MKHRFSCFQGKLKLSNQILSNNQKSFQVWTTFDHNFLMNILKDQQKSRNLQRFSRLQWLEEEQNYLKKLYIDQGIKSWKDIGFQMKKAFPNRQRTPKQYRQRFTNYVRFEGHRVERGCWTQDQDRIIFEKYMQMGSKWVQISKMTPGRSQNNVKNRFYSALRKLVRRINVVLSQNKKKHNIRKPIKQTTVFKLLQTENITSQLKNQDFTDKAERECFLFELKHDCIDLAMKLEGQIDGEKLFSAGTRLHKFNTITRFECLRKSRKAANLKRRALPPIQKKNDPQGKVEFISEPLQISNMEEELPDKSSKQTQEIELAIRTELLNQGVEWNLQINLKNITDKPLDDLEFQLCQILGIQYQPPQFSCI